MSALAADIALCVAVLTAWLGCAGFARLRAPLDRLHCVAFVNVASGSAVVLAAVLSDGATPRVGKIVLVVAVSLLVGGATSHAIGRMVMRRPTSSADARPYQHRACE